MTALIALTLAFIFGCFALGLLIPRFLGRCATMLWERRMRDRLDSAIVLRAPGETPDDREPFDVSDETGGTVPSIVTVLAAVAGIYLLVLAVRLILT